MLATQAQHNVFLDISRLHLVSAHSFSRLHMCCNVQYLDLSYNRVEASHIALLGEHCKSLRSLILAGLRFTNNVRDYDPLSNLPQLELLSLRSSENVTSTEVFKDLSMLRSLDLGETRVTSIAALSGLTRLEELCLDNCTALIDTAQSLACLPKLKMLRLLNVQGTPLESFRSDNGMILLDALASRDICVESQTRAELFLQSIIDNDEPAMRRYVSSGQDVNCRFGPWADKIFAAAWLTRCRETVANKQLQTPCFLCSHPQEELRPTPLHVAIMFNAQDCLAFLRFVNADLKASCWLGDVVYNAQRDCLEENESAPSAASKDKKGLAAANDDGAFSSYSTEQLPEVMFEKNVHRLTEGMVPKKLSDWKKRIAELRDDILLILQNSFPVVLAKRRAAAEKQAEAERIAAELRLAQEAKVQAMLDAKAAEDRAAKGLPTHAPGKPSAAQAWPESKRKLAEAEANAAEQQAKEEEERAAAAARSESKVEDDRFGGGYEDEEGEVVDDSSRPPTSHADAGISVLEAPISELALVEGKEEKQEEKEEEDEKEKQQQPAVYVKPGRKPLEILKKRESGFHWRMHGMVTKLNEAPLQYRSSRGTAEVLVLGNKSFWLETEPIEVERRQVIDEKRRAEHERRVQTDLDYAHSYARVKMQRGLKDYRPKPPVPERKSEFLDLIKARTARKYIVRDDISEDEPSEEEEEEDDEEEEGERAAAATATAEEK